MVQHELDEASSTDKSGDVQLDSAMGSNDIGTLPVNALQDDETRYEGQTPNIDTRPKAQ